MFRVFFGHSDSTTQGVVAPEDKMVEIVERQTNVRLGGRSNRVEAINTVLAAMDF